MKTIWKYPLAITDEQTVTMPAGAQILKHAECVQDMHPERARRSVIHIWALVDAPLEVLYTRRLLRVVGTGNPLPKHLGEHVATVRDGSFIWHVFDVGEVR